MASLADELQGLGLNKPEALKFSKTLVVSFGAGNWDDAVQMPTAEFDQALSEAKLLSVSVRKLTDVKKKKDSSSLYFLPLIIFFSYQILFSLSIKSSYSGSFIFSLWSEQYQYSGGAGHG